MPTRIQRAVVPVMLAGRDVLASAPTGSGKTLAYVAPMVHHIQAHCSRIPSPSPAPTAAVRCAVAHPDEGQCAISSIRDTVQAAGLCGPRGAPPPLAKLSAAGALHNWVFSNRRGLCLRAGRGWSRG